MRKTCIFTVFIILCYSKLHAQTPALIGNSIRIGDTIFTYSLTSDNKAGKFYIRLHDGDTLISFFQSKNVISVIEKTDSTNLEAFFSNDSNTTNYNGLKNIWGITYYSRLINDEHIVDSINGFNLALKYIKSNKYAKIDFKKAKLKYKMDAISSETLDYIISTGTHGFAITKSTEFSPTIIFLLSKNKTFHILYQYSEESPW